MATNLIETTFASTYKDDFKDSDNYHRVLFNSGKVLQARELTQSQTIIQKEIERFGKNIFKEGALVRPGGTTLNTQREFIKLTTVNGSQFNSIIIGETNTNSGIKFEVIDKITGTNSSTDPDTLIVKYTNVTSAVAGSSVSRIGNSVNLSFASISGTVSTATTNASGIGSSISVDNSDYFVQGHFVFVEKQTIPLEKYSSTPTKDVGFKITETIVTSNDETALFDNQGEVPNTAASGADRYRIRLSLTTRDQIQSSENFVYLMRVENGSIVDEIDPNDDYNLISDFMALRTKEESGDYIVKPFTAKFNDLNDSNLQLEVSSGIAYIDGYRADIPSKKITVPKSRTTETLDNQRIVAGYGNYILVAHDTGNGAGLPNIDALQKLNLNDNTGLTGNTIGTARVRSVDRDGSNLRYYLFDVLMNANKSFSSVKSIGNTTSKFNNLVLENSLAVLKSTGNNSVLFDLPFTKPAFNGFNDMQYRFRSRVTAISNGSGEATFQAPTSPSQSTFHGSPTLDYIISEEDNSSSEITSSASMTKQASDTQLQVTGLSNSTTYELIATFQTTSQAENSVRLKTLQDTTFTIEWPTDAKTDANGTRFIDLNTADIYSVSRVRKNDSDGIDLLSYFTLDDGQRDNYYQNGRLLETPGLNPPIGDIFVRFKHFNHTGGGNAPGASYFSVQSYINAFGNLGFTSGSGDAYKSIPSYTKSNGSTINLRDVLDFRSIEDPAGNYDSNGTGGNPVINFVPRVDTTITSDITHYQQRKDELVAVLTNNEINREGSGELQVSQGVPSLFSPQPPATPEGSLTLYDFNINAFTLNESDISSTLIPHKRYTMKDIGRIEQRIDKLEETTTLNLLEVNAESLFVLDSDDNPRIKSGFLADNFSSYALSDINNEDYRASISLGEKTLSVPVYPKSTRLNFNSSDTTNVSLKGDFALLDIDSNPVLINQDLCTTTVNVNPFNVITSLGHIDLSPSSDDWVEIEYDADRLVQGEDIVTHVSSSRTTRSLNNWSSSWVGVPTSGNNFVSSVQVQVSSQTIREEIGDKIVEISVIPFMRSRKIAFNVQGLQPNCRHFAFFGGESIANFIRQEPDNFLDSNRFALSTRDEGNIYTKTSAHPDGVTTLTSNSEGKIQGTFLIPSTTSLKFRTGEQEFKLLNISVDDETNSTSTAATTFLSSGVLQTRQKTIQSTRHINTTRIRRVRPRDPVAQSFRVDHVQNPNGVFLTKVDVFFASKDTTVPVQLQIRPVENGVPTGEPIPGAVKFLSPSSVNIASTNVATVQASPTNFQFDEPIYLPAGFDYAIVLLAETNAYTVHVAEVYEFLLGSTTKRVQKQPTMGSLFLSQNGRTWTPDQSKDLMFKIYRAQFASSGNLVLKNAPVAKYLLENNSLLSDSDDTVLTVFQEGHGFDAGDTVNISGLDSATYGGIDVTQISGDRTINAVDHTGYTVTVGDTFSNAARFGGTQTLVTQNARYDHFAPQIQTLLPNSTNLGASIKSTSAASYGSSSVAGTRNYSLSNNYTLSTTYQQVTLNSINTLGDPKIILSQENEDATISDKSFHLKLDLSTTDTRVSPVIDLQRASVITFDNLIDNQNAAGNVALSSVAETNPFGGTSAAKHLTVPVTLAEAAVGLKIILAANRPDESNFRVYFRTATSDGVLSSQPFILASKEVDLSADEISGVFRDYEYLIGGIGGDLEAFTKFQIKIIMDTTNSSKVPTFRDLRVIALAV